MSKLVLGAVGKVIGGIYSGPYGAQQGWGINVGLKKNKRTQKQKDEVQSRWNKRKLTRELKGLGKDVNKKRRI